MFANLRVQRSAAVLVLLQLHSFLFNLTYSVLLQGSTIQENKVLESFQMEWDLHKLLLKRK